MAAAIALAERGQGRTGNNPSVGCIIVQHGRVVGQGWTQPGGRPHAEAMALQAAGSAAQGATVYATLEPCAHQSPRGPCCADLLIAARIGRLVCAIVDPDARTAGAGLARVSDADIPVDRDVKADAARLSLAGFLSRVKRGRPHVTLKLATSLDGSIALPNGESRWITGEPARAHAHVERARCDAILVGSGTVNVDRPSLDVRLEGMEDRSPQRIMLGSADPPQGWRVIRSPAEIAGLDCNRLLVEGGAKTAASFIAAGLVDRLMLYRAPILIGAGQPCLGDIGLAQLSDAHGRWRVSDTRCLGKDRLEVYEATSLTV